MRPTTTMVSTNAKTSALEILTRHRTDSAAMPSSCRRQTKPICAASGDHHNHWPDRSPGRGDDLEPEPRRTQRLIVDNADGRRGLHHRYGTVSGKPRPAACTSTCAGRRVLGDGNDFGYSGERRTSTPRVSVRSEAHHHCTSDSRHPGSDGNAREIMSVCMRLSSPCAL